MGDRIVRFLLVQRESNHHTQFDGTSLPSLYRALKGAYEDQKLPTVQWLSHFVHALGKDNSQKDQAFRRKLLEASSMTHVLLPDQEHPTKTSSTIECTHLYPTCPYSPMV